MLDSIRPDLQALEPVAHHCSHWYRWSQFGVFVFLSLFCSFVHFTRGESSQCTLSIFENTQIQYTEEQTAHGLSHEPLSSLPLSAYFSFLPLSFFSHFAQALTGDHITQPIAART